MKTLKALLNIINPTYSVFAGGVIFVIGAMSHSFPTGVLGCSLIVFGFFLSSDGD